LPLLLTKGLSGELSSFEESAIQRDIDLAYCSNLARYELLHGEGDGFILASSLPSTSEVPSFDVHEIGSWVLVALKSEPTGKTCNACGEIPTHLEYAEAQPRLGEGSQSARGHPDSLQERTTYREARKLALAQHKIDLRWPFHPRS